MVTKLSFKTDSAKNCKNHICWMEHASLGSQLTCSDVPLLYWALAGGVHKQETSHKPHSSSLVGIWCLSWLEYKYIKIQLKTKLMQISEQWKMVNFHE